VVPLILKGIKNMVKRKKKRSNIRTKVISIFILFAFAVLTITILSSKIKFSVLSSSEPSQTLSNYYIGYPQNIEYTGNENSENALKQEKELIFFTSSWCGPCNMVRKMIVDNFYSLKDVKIYEVDIDSEKDLANKYEISFAPALVLDDKRNIEKVTEFDVDKIQDLIKAAGNLE
jgi:thioredoxin 1